MSNIKGGNLKKKNHKKMNIIIRTTSTIKKMIITEVHLWNWGKKT